MIKMSILDDILNCGDDRNKINLIIEEFKKNHKNLPALPISLNDNIITVDPCREYPPCWQNFITIVRPKLKDMHDFEDVSALINTELSKYKSKWCDNVVLFNTIDDKIMFILKHS